MRPELQEASSQQDRGNLRSEGLVKKDNGFSLVEILIALSVGSLVVLSIYALLEAVQRSTVGLERKVSAHQDTRAALELMAQEIRMASFNPTSVEGIWRKYTATCGEFSGTQSYRGIQEATDNSITVEMDINENQTIAVPNDNNPSEIIRYNYSNKFISRRTNCDPTPEPFLGDSSSGSRFVRVVNDEAGIAIFKYYNGKNALISESNLPAKIPDIRRIEITLIVETEDIDPNTNQRKRMTYSTSVIPRNHARYDVP